MQGVYKICPQCRVEYQRSAERCADCGCALADRAPEREAEAPAAELPPAGELVCLFVGNPWDARGVAEALQDAGVSCRVDSYPPGAPLAGPDWSARKAFTGSGTQVGVYVLPGDRAAALELARASQAERLPEGEAPGAAGGELDACPGCGSPLASAAESCAECGLEFPTAEVDPHGDIS